MLKKLSILFLVLALTALVGLPFLNAKSAEVFRVLAIRVSTGEKSAKIIWSTNYPSTGHFDFGITNGFGAWVDDNTDNNYHETVLGGLKPEQKYYFRLTAKARDGQTIVSDIYEFKTSDENDKEAPILKNVRASFITGNTATFVWETDELADSCVKFGLMIADNNPEKCNGERVNIHDITVDGLKNNSTYYYQAASRDKAGNRQFSITYHLVTVVEEDKTAPDLIIYEVAPFNQKSAEGLTQAKVVLRTNRSVGGSLKYGEKTNSYNKEIKLSAPRSTETTILLTDLKADQRYYYKLYLTDVISRKLETQEYTFNTLPKNILPEPISSGGHDAGDLNQDFDEDGLTNGQEKQYGTDPVRADTDGDGYLDGVEVRNNFNPWGSGALPNAKTNASGSGYAYGRPRLSSLTVEQNMAKDLQNKLQIEFNGNIPKNKQNWYALVRAYVYGAYPVKAIAQAIKHGGKTVHPTIPWPAWQNSADYQNYINK